MAGDRRADQVAEIWERLDQVSDPELDESVTELGFVTAVDVDAECCVHIQFRLPTYWCAANFAFMMADDMRTVVKALAWVGDVEIVLGEHMYADTINRGIAEGRSFQQTFGAEATGNLDEVRATFLRKAFQRRQQALLCLLGEAGYSPGDLTTMTIDQLRRLPIDAVGRRLVGRYLERRDLAGPGGQEALAFVSVDGTALSADGFGKYLANLRRVRVNAEFNGALCRGLLAARFDTTTPLSSPAK